MKNPMNMLTEIKNLLGVELSEETKEVEVTAEEVKVELAQMKLENGTILEAEAFEGGNEVFIVTEDDKVALPVGEYVLEDGKVLKVEEEGIIKEIAESSEEEVEEEVVSEEMAEEEIYATKEELAEIKSMVEEIREMIKPKEEMKEEVKEEDILKEELSKPATQPLKHSPENKEELKRLVFGQKRQMNTKDRVLNRILNS